jgi:hypothetical protein
LTIRAIIGTPEIKESTLVGRAPPYPLSGLQRSAEILNRRSPWGRHFTMQDIDSGIADNQWHLAG